MFRPEDVIADVFNPDPAAMASNFSSRYTGQVIRYTGVVVRKNLKEGLIIFKGGGFLTTAYDIQASLADEATQNFNDVTVGSKISIVGILDHLVPPPLGIGSNSIRLTNVKVLSGDNQFHKDKSNFHDITPSPSNETDGNGYESYLNDSYKHCLAQAPLNQQELIRIAQRSWIKYNDKTHIALNALGATQDFTKHIDARECFARGAQLSHYYDKPSRTIQELQAAKSQAESSLNIIYANSLSRLSASDKNNLIQAERAWVDFKDKDILANTSVNPGKQGLLIQIDIINQRIAELKSIYQN